MEWPRGVAKEQASLDLWLKDVAPSAELRRWYSHDLEKWSEFRRRYWQELERCPDAVAKLRDLHDRATLTLVHAARDEHHCNTAVLKDFLEPRQAHLP